MPFPLQPRSTCIYVYACMVIHASPCIDLKRIVTDFVGLGVESPAAGWYRVLAGRPSML